MKLDTLYFYDKEGFDGSPWFKEYDVKTVIIDKTPLIVVTKGWAGFAHSDVREKIFNDEQAAINMANKVWNQMKRKGYKSLADLNITEQKDGKYCWTRKLGSNNCDVPYYGNLYDCVPAAFEFLNKKQ